MAHMQGRLAKYKVPRRVELMGALPLSSMGKILKRDLRAQFVNS
jgi:fatty-acyl-CoA synthase